MGEISPITLISSPQKKFRLKDNMPVSTALATPESERLGGNRVSVVIHKPGRAAVTSGQCLIPGEANITDRECLW